MELLGCKFDEIPTHYKQRVLTKCTSYLLNHERRPELRAAVQPEPPRGAVVAVEAHLDGLGLRHLEVLPELSVRIDKAPNT